MTEKSAPSSTTKTPAKAAVKPAVKSTAKAASPQEKVPATPSGLIDIDGEQLTVEQLAARYKSLKASQADLNSTTVKEKKAVLRRREEQSLKPYQAELIKLQNHLEDTHTRMIVLFEGRDAAGKGGTIRRMIRYMNEKRYRVVALGKPTLTQQSQWYFQRYVEQFPRGGEMVLFDRSWYNRSMVEPVFGFCTDEQYKTFMAGVTGFEKDLVRNGTILVKLYFSVTKAEQKRRFDRRKNDPLRSWKLSEVDVQAQDRWDDFTEMKYEMLKRTHTQEAPWTVIRSDDKYAARLNAMKVILNTVNYKDRAKNLNYVPDPNIIVSGGYELELMERHLLHEGKFMF